MPVNETHQIILAFDFGMKRIGIAIGQTITKSTNALLTLPAKKGVPQWEQLDKLIDKWQPSGLVIGIPLNMDGSEQVITQNARQFANQLKARYNIPIYSIDERLTTKDARERLFAAGGFKALQNGQVDSMAAQLILQNWFAENKK